MNKNAFYLAVFAVLCVLAGVFVGAGIAKGPYLPRPEQGRPNFGARAERFMGYGPMMKGAKQKGNPADMLAAKLELTADQKTKVTDILEKSRQEIEAVGKNLRSSIAEIKTKGDAQIMAILTPVQQEKFKALQKQFGKGCGGMHGPEGMRMPGGHQGMRGMSAPGDMAPQGEELPPLPDGPAPQDAPVPQQ